MNPNPAGVRAPLMRHLLIFTAVFTLIAAPLVAYPDMEVEWLISSLVLASALIALAAIDMASYRLPDRLTLPLLALGLLRAAVSEGEFPMWSVASALGGGVFLYSIGWVYQQLRKREGLGFGDTKLFAAAGAWVGAEGLASVLFIACLAALTCVGAARIAGKQINGEMPIPFGPFLAIGAWAIWLYGPIA